MPQYGGYQPPSYGGGYGYPNPMPYGCNTGYGNGKPSYGGYPTPTSEPGTYPSEPEAQPPAVFDYNTYTTAYFNKINKYCPAFFNDSQRQATKYHFRSQRSQNQW